MIDGQSMAAWNLEEVRSEAEQVQDRRVDVGDGVAVLDSEGTQLGGLAVQVGNLVMDATVRGRLEKLRRQVATAA